MSLKYVTRINSKNKPITIIPPTPDEIIDENFDYPSYIEDALNFEGDYDRFVELYNKTHRPIPPKEENIFKEFEKQIIKIQTIYENDIMAGTRTMDYNEEMKKIARSYYQKLQSQITLKAQKEENFAALIAKRKELVFVLNQMLEVKRKIESTSSSRLHDFNEGKLSIKKLYLYDLNKFTSDELNMKNRMLLSECRRQIFSCLLEKKGVYYTPIENLNLKGIKK